MNHFIRSAVGTATLVAIAGCSSGSTSVPAAPIEASPAPMSSSAPANAAAVKVGAKFVFNVSSPSANPKSTRLASSALRPMYLPATSKSVAVKVSYAAGATTGAPGTVATTLDVDLASLSCSTDPNTGNRSCATSVSLLPDAYVADITAYDATAQGGNVLSQALAAPFTVAPGTVNSVAVTLVGVPKSIVIVPDSAKTTSNHAKLDPSSRVEEIAGVVPVSFLVLGVDADGNAITSGKPTFSNLTAVSSDPTQFAVSGFVNDSFTLVTKALDGGAASTLSATATYNGSTLSASMSVKPVEELFVSGYYVTAYGYAMYTSGPVLLDTIPNVGNGNKSIRTLHDGKSLVAYLGNAGQFFTIDGTLSPTVTGTTSVNNSNGNDFAPSLDDSLYYLPDAGDINHVALVDPKSGATNTIYYPTRAQDVDLDAAGNVYATDYTTNEIDRLAVGGTSFSPYVTGIGQPLNIRIGNAANGGYIYVADANRNVQIFSGTTKTFGSAVKGVAFAFDQAGETFVLDVDTNPASIVVYPPNSVTPKPGRAFNLLSGTPYGSTMDFVI